MRMRRALCLFAGLAMLLSLVGSTAAQRPAASPYVDLALVLAVDASGSVDQVRFELQKQGYVAAFRHPRVLNAIQSGPTQSIAVIMMQWTGPALQVIAVPWTRISDAASVNAGDPLGFTVTISNTGQSTATGVSLSDALPAGPTWSIDGGADQASFTITGSSPQQLELVGQPTTLAAGASKTVHITAQTSAQE